MANIETKKRQGFIVTLVGIIANFILVGIKVYAGLLSKSQALIADGIHSLSDLFSDIIVLFGLKYGIKDADENHPFGHGRIETLSSMTIGILLIGAGVGIVYNSVVGLYEHKISEPTLFTLTIAGVSILIKEAMYWYTYLVGKKIKSVLLVANAWHHRTDALSSVAVLIGIGGVYINPNWYLADTLASLFVTYFILRVGGEMVWQALKEVVDTAPDKEILDEIKSIAQNIDGVLDAHDIHARYLGGQIHSEIHIVVDPEITVSQGHNLAKAVEFAVIEKVEDLVRVIVHVDPEDDIED